MNYYQQAVLLDKRNLFEAACDLYLQDISGPDTNPESYVNLLFIIWSLVWDPTLEGADAVDVQKVGSLYDSYDRIYQSGVERFPHFINLPLWNSLLKSISEGAPFDEAELDRIAAAGTSVDSDIWFFRHVPDMPVDVSNHHYSLKNGTAKERYMASIIRSNHPH